MKKLVSFLTIVMLASLLWNCSEEESGDVTLTGSAVKGTIINADVEVYALNETAARGELLATTSTNSDGQFNVTIDYEGGVEIVITGGSYTDEATGEEVSVGEFEFRNIIIAENNKSIGVTALTTIAAEHINENASEGLATAIDNANQKVAETFGIGDIDISNIVPADLSETDSKNAEKAEKEYGAVQAGLSELLVLNDLSPDVLPVLIKEMAEDFSDGKFDGKNGESALEFTLTITPEEAFKGLNTAIDNFLNGPRNNSDYIPDDIGF